MPDCVQEIHDILIRLEKVETENRRLKQVGLAALLLIGSFVLMGQAQSSRVVGAEKFILRDGIGRTRGELGMCSSDPCLRLFDDDGTRRSVMSSSGFTIESADIDVLKDRNDSSKGFEHVKGPSVLLSQYGLSVEDKHENRMLVDFDWTQGVDSPSLTLFGREKRNGKWSRIELSTLIDGPSVSLSDAQQFSAVLGSTSLQILRTGETHTRSVASIVLFGPDGKVLWSAP